MIPRLELIVMQKTQSVKQREVIKTLKPEMKKKKACRENLGRQTQTGKRHIQIKGDKAKIESSKLEAAAGIGSTLEAAETSEVVETVKNPADEKKPRRRGWWSRD